MPGKMLVSMKQSIKEHIQHRELPITRLTLSKPPYSHLSLKAIELDRHDSSLASIGARLSHHDRVNGDTGAGRVTIGDRFDAMGRRAAGLRVGRHVSPPSQPCPSGQVDGVGTAIDIDASSTGNVYVRGNPICGAIATGAITSARQSMVSKVQRLEGNRLSERQR